MTLFLLFALAQPLACHPIQADSIYGRDLAAAVPELATLPPDLPFGLSPIPGQSRVFRAAELHRIALANHIVAKTLPDICFAWTVSVPAQKDVLAAIRKTLENRVSQVEIVDQSLVPAPAGTIVFPLSGLSGESDRPVIWHGYVQYAGNHRFPIWARVRITVNESRIVTTTDLSPQEPIRADQIKVESYAGPIPLHPFVADASKSVGFVPRRYIPSGSPLTEDMIEPQPEVERGDVVEVIVQNGAARVEAKGIAQQSGVTGEVIGVKNAKTGRPFRARVESKDVVVLVPGGLTELAQEGSAR